MKHFLLLPLLFLVLRGSAAIVSGMVSDEKGQPLSFASVSVKGSNKGAAANAAGRFSFNLDPGSYTVVVRHVGYQTKEILLQMPAENFTLSVSLAEQELKMEEVVIKQGDDPALVIMRQAIAKRAFYQQQVDSLSVDVYIKGLVRSRTMPGKILGQKIDKEGLHKNGLVDEQGKGILYLSESLTRVSYVRPNNFKFDVLSSRGSGGDLGFSFPFFVSFYTNNVQLFNGGVNPRGFISPLADAAFHYYKFRFEGSFFEGGKMIDRIRVTPRRKNEPLFEGWVQIVDGEWRIHSLNLLASKEQGLDLLDSLRVTQTQTEVADGLYKTGHQAMSFSAKFFGFGVSGDFLNVYQNYNLSPGFGRRHFNRILLAYDTAGTHRDTTYWSAVRPVPLEVEERQNFLLRDSLAKAARQAAQQQRADSTRPAQSISLVSLLVTGVNRGSRSENSSRSYRLEPLLPNNLRYNTVEGASVSLVQTLRYEPAGGKRQISLTATGRYGFANGHFNPFAVLTVSPKTETYPATTWQLTGGKKVLQFNRDNPVSDLANTYYSLFLKQNFQKLYEAYTAEAAYNTRFENGLTLNLAANYEDRLPLRNNGSFSVFNKGAATLPNHPYELAETPFERHVAVVVSASVRFQPGQKYIRFPGLQVPLRSSAPVFELRYDKGLPSVLGSVADFDKWKFTVSDELSLRLAGSFKYRAGAGGFLNRRRVDIPDFTHFNGNQTLLAVDYLNSFQLAPYYRYSNTERLYGLLHAEHHFNGLLTNKIPLLNKRKWNLVTGTNTFYVNRNNYYTEAFVGLENILKFLRVDFVTAYQPAPGRTVGVRIGAGGLLGGLGKK